MTRLSFNLWIRWCRCTISKGWRHSLWLLQELLLWHFRLPLRLVRDMRLLFGTLGMAPKLLLLPLTSPRWYMLHLIGFVNSQRRMCAASWKLSHFMSGTLISRAQNHCQNAAISLVYWCLLGLQCFKLKIKIKAHSQSVNIENISKILFYKIRNK